MWKVILPILKRLGKEALIFVLQYVLELLQKKHNVIKEEAVARAASKSKTLI